MYSYRFKMKSLKSILVILVFLLNIGAMTTGIKILKSTDFETCQPTSNNIFYRKSTVDLIVNFFKTYKHIKRITLFLCDNTSAHLSVSIRVPFDSHRNMMSSAKVEWQTFEQNHEHHENGCLNFQQIVKYLMASGNFLIKGDGNIDATRFTTTTTTVGNACNMDTEYGKLDSDNTYSLRDMLKSGDFKQGVIIDLRCRQSRFILQQVNKKKILCRQSLIIICIINTRFIISLMQFCLNSCYFVEIDIFLLTKSKFHKIIVFFFFVLVCICKFTCTTSFS